MISKAEEIEEETLACEVCDVEFQPTRRLRCCRSDLSVSDAAASLRTWRKQEVGPPKQGQPCTGPSCGRIEDTTPKVLREEGRRRSQTVRIKQSMSEQWEEATCHKKRDAESMERLIMMAEKTEESLCQLRFHVTDARKMLASVDRISAAGKYVHFGQHERDNWINCKSTGRTAFMTKRNGLYLLEVHIWNAESWGEGDRDRLGSDRECDA